MDFIPGILIQRPRLKCLICPVKIQGRHNDLPYNRWDYWWINYSKSTKSSAEGSLVCKASCHCQWQRSSASTRSLLSKDPRQLANLQLANLLDKFCPGSQEIIFKDKLEDFFQHFAELTKWQSFSCAHLRSRDSQAYQKICLLFNICFIPLTTCFRNKF